MNVHYALQTCDGKFNQTAERYVNEPKSVVVKKCVTSFLLSVKYAANVHPDVNHIVRIIDDESSENTVQYLKKLCDVFSVDNVSVEFTKLENGGVMNSMRACLEWLEKEGTDIVYQVQDDMLYEETAIYEMIDVLFQLKYDTGSDIMVVPYFDPRHWLDVSYRYRPTPRTIVPGIKRYWIQCYDIPCSFVISKHEFSKHWDLYEKFLSFSPTFERLEADSLNHILVRRGVLCLMPFNSVALHIQSEREKDPYIDWKSRWDSINYIE